MQSFSVQFDELSHDLRGFRDVLFAKDVFHQVEVLEDMIADV